MPGETVPTDHYDYADGPIQLAVDSADEGRIRVRAGAAGCALSFELSVLGAQRLNSMIDSAISRAITRGFPSNG